MRKALNILFFVSLLVLVGCSNNKVVIDDHKQPEDISNTEMVVTHTGTIKVLDKIMEFELYGEIAPITVANFVELVNSGFYNGLIFHRVISDFMIQGGDPLGTGMGGSDNTIVGEFKNNNIENPISHTRGVMSMARSSMKDSASSQFFICHKDASFLDGDYAAFGKITNGLDVVDKIASVETDSRDKPLQDVVITSITMD